MSKRAIQPEPKSYEEAEQELSTILSDIEGAAVSLEESLRKYERGMYLLQYCRSILDRAEKQIEQLSRAEDGGLKASPLASPPDDEALA